MLPTSSLSRSERLPSLSEPRYPMSCDSAVGSFGQLFRLKFGQCFGCMRLASSLGFGLVVIALFLPAGLFRSGLAAGGAIFLIWWVAHLVAHAAYASRERQFLVRLPSRQPITSSPSGYVLKRTLAALVQTSPLWGLLRWGDAAAAWPVCNCYFTRDCWWIAGRFCNWSVQCSTIRKGTGDCPEWEGYRGNCDGVCEFITPFGAAGLTLDELAGRVGAVLDLYI